MKKSAPTVAMNIRGKFTKRFLTIFLIFLSFLYASKICPKCKRIYPDVDTFGYPVNFCKYCKPPTPLEPIGVQKMGCVFLSSNPTGARVFLDGDYKGITPLLLGDLPITYYKVCLSKETYQDTIFYIIPEPNDTINYYITLLRKTPPPEIKNGSGKEEIRTIPQLITKKKRLLAEISLGSCEIGLPSHWAVKVLEVTFPLREAISLKTCISEFQGFIPFFEIGKKSIFLSLPAYIYISPTRWSSFLIGGSAWGGQPAEGEVTPPGTAMFLITQGEIISPALLEVFYIKIIGGWKKIWWRNSSTSQSSFYSGFGVMWGLRSWEGFPLH